MHKTLAAAVMATALAGTAEAQQQDAQVVQALDEMVWAFGVECQMGNARACTSVAYIEDYGGRMLHAGNACQYGDQAACQFYQQAYYELSGLYAQFHQQPWVAKALDMAPDGYRATHEARMQAIHTWGAENAANWPVLTPGGGEAHQRFINSLRQ